MHFDECCEGDYKIYAGALQSPAGDGYVAAVVVNRVRPDDMQREAFRDVNMADGRRWRTPAEALSHAVATARQLIRVDQQRLAC